MNGSPLHGPRHSYSPTGTRPGGPVPCSGILATSKNLADIIFLHRLEAPGKRINTFVQQIRLRINRKSQFADTDVATCQIARRISKTAKKGVSRTNSCEIRAVICQHLSESETIPNGLISCPKRYMVNIALLCID